MVVVRQAGVLLLAALISSRGLFAQDGAPPDSLDQVPAMVTATAADEVKVLLRPVEIRYMQQEEVLLPRAAHGIYTIARIVVAKDPLLAERKPAWSVKERDTGGLWRDRINIAWVDAYNDSVWIYSAQLAAEAVRMGFQEVQFDYVRFPD